MSLSGLQRKIRNMLFPDAYNHIFHLLSQHETIQSFTESICRQGKKARMSALYRHVPLLKKKTDTPVTPDS